MLSISKLVLQDAAEKNSTCQDDPLTGPELFDAFPEAMRKEHAAGPWPIASRNGDHRHEGRQPDVVNRLGAQRALSTLRKKKAHRCTKWSPHFPGGRTPARPRSPMVKSEKGMCGKRSAIELFSIAAASVRSHLSDILRWR